MLLYLILFELFICRYLRSFVLISCRAAASDSLVMLKNSPTLIALCVSYVVSLSLLNNFMQVISKELSAIIRQLVSTCRVVVVWGVGLIIYNYDQSLGESWDKWSFMQLGAFIVLVRIVLSIRRMHQ